MQKLKDTITTDQEYHSLRNDLWDLLVKAEIVNDSDSEGNPNDEDFMKFDDHLYSYIVGGRELSSIPEEDLQVKAYNENNPPEDVRKILHTFDYDADAYKECDRLLKELKPLGYTFDYGLSGEPFNLKKIPTQAPEVFARLGGQDLVVSKDDYDNDKYGTDCTYYLIGYEDVDGRECNEDGTYL